MKNHQLSIDRYEAYKDSGVEWLGDVPEHWELNRHKDNFVFVNKRCNDSKLFKVGLENIESKTGQFLSTESEFDGDGIEFRENDILLGKLRPYLAKVYLAQFNGNAIGDIFVYRTKLNTQSKFAYYLMLSSRYIDVMNSSTVGAKMPRVSSDFIANLIVATPSLSEQKLIAHYLDTKTAQIDRKIDLLTQKATLYGDLKRSLINETVTRGLDKSVAMKNSGIEWLGEVPDHWGIYHLKSCVRVKITDGPHETPAFTDFGVPFISAEAIQNGSINFNSKRGYISEQTDKVYALKCKPKKEDIFVVKSGSTTGKIGYVSTDISFNIWSPLALIRANKVNYSRYLYYFLSSSFFQDQVQMYWSFGTQPNIGMKVLENLQVITPPLIEQKVIADYLDTKTAQIDQIIQTINTQIEKLKELRKTLINDVVTGKIKIMDN